MRIARPLASLAVALVLVLPGAASAADVADRLAPAKPGWPLAHPIAPTDIAPPPLSLVSDRPVNPAYVPGLPGLPQARFVTDDYGAKRPKFDGVLIGKSRVDGGHVVIPPGGLVYLEDTWGGEVALRGEPIPVLGRLSTYVDYDMSVVVKENVTIPAGQSVNLGGPGVKNIDLVLGQGRVTGQAILKDVGRAALVRTYKALEQAPAPSKAGFDLDGLGLPVAFALVGGVAIGYGARRRTLKGT